MKQLSNVFIIEGDDITGMQSDLSAIKSALEKALTKNQDSDYIESRDVRELLGISQKTWQSYRDKGLISFIQIQKKVWVKREDLQKFMDNHYINTQL